MKNVCAVILLAASFGCTPSSTESAYEKQVADFIRSKADDPASYAPVRFGPPTAYRVQDQNAIKALEMDERVSLYTEYMEREAAREVRMVRMNASPQQLKPVQDSFKESKAEAKKAITLRDSLQNANDTTRIGYSLVHAFRLKNKFGALVLDSARFLVKTDGTVSVL